jgi:hypothetical protein
MSEQEINTLVTKTSSLSIMNNKQSKTVKEKQKPKKQKNRGTGAGGANTNLNGIKLEDKVRNTITKNSEVIESEKTKNKWKIETVMINGNENIRAPENAFKRYETKKYKTSKNDKLAGTIHPDDILISEIKKIINWIEAKVQKKSGSKQEVLQSYPNKIKNLKKRFPDYEINYIYVLDNYFKDNAKAEIKDLKDDNISFIFDNDTNFEKNLLKLIK